MPETENAWRLAIFDDLAYVAARSPLRYDGPGSMYI
jgi:hypothetical protein